MNPENVQKAKRLDERTRVPSEEPDTVAPANPENETLEKAVLIVADECVNPAEYRGILTPELRTRLDAMTRDYARILTRIDRMVDRRGQERGISASRRRDIAN